MTATANTQEGATEYREPVVPLTGEFYLIPEKLPGERRRKNPKLRVDLTPSSVAGKTLSEGYFETVSSKQGGFNRWLQHCCFVSIVAGRRRLLPGF